MKSGLLILIGFITVPTVLFILIKKVFVNFRAFKILLKALAILCFFAGIYYFYTLWRGIKLF